MIDYLRATIYLHTAISLLQVFSLLFQRMRRTVFGVWVISNCHFGYFLYTLFATADPCSAFLINRPIQRKLLQFNQNIRKNSLALSSTYAQNSDDNKPYQRRQKFNKYRKKNDDDAKDPLEQLMEESREKLKELEKEAEAKKSKRLSNKDKELAQLKQKKLQLAFPDNKDIDPNDPSSFGFVEIGTVVGAHGVHGQVKVKSTSDFPARFTEPGLRYFKPHNKRAPRKIVLLEGKPSKEGEYIVELDDVKNREDAKRLRGGSLYVRIEERDAVMSSTVPKKDGNEEEESKGSALSPTSVDDEYFISDLVGLEVFLEQDEDQAGSDKEDETHNRSFVGYVAGVVLAQEMCSIPGLGHDMLEIVLPRGKGGTISLRDELVLVPFVPEIVPRVEISKRAIFLTPPPGLLDITYVREEKVRIKGFLPAASDV